LLRASTGIFLPPPPSVEALQRLSTNAVSTTRTQGTSSGVASNAYVGNFHELLFGIRNGLALEISRQAADSTSSAFANRQVFVRVYGRYDVALTHPAAFRVIEGIL
jgi:HK97 family phage major capsid protein